jgi:hypothetical protein
MTRSVCAGSLCQLTIGELKTLVRDAVHEEMQALVAPEYLSAEQVPEVIGCGVESIRTYSARVRLTKSCRWLAAARGDASLPRLD